MSEVVEAFKRGERMFQWKRPCPPRPADDDPCTSPDSAEWLGWMLGRAMEMHAFIKDRERIMSLLDAPFSEADLSEFDIGANGVMRAHAGRGRARP